MGDGHPVLVLPGFMAGDMSTGYLRRFLSSRGYNVYPWTLGRNLGPQVMGENFEHIIEHIERIAHENQDHRLSLVGWSLGGVLAREIAKLDPSVIRQVISLGSPFAGSPESSAAWPIYKLINGDDIHTQPFQEQLKTLSSPPEEVPTTSIFSKADGVVHWRGSIEKPSDHTDNIEVRTAHCALGFNAPTLYAIADRLAQPDGQWKPFDRSGWRALVYPFSGHLED
jgi:pimeloyl-ACP methyl ester carboxylesterase